MGYYHCLSRVVDRRFIFGDAERERFVELMREYERFCGVRVLTFCVMSNHFHMLVEVAKAPEIKPTAEEIRERLRELTGCQDAGAAWQEERCGRMELKATRRGHAGGAGRRSRQAWKGWRSVTSGRV